MLLTKINYGKFIYVNSTKFLNFVTADTIIINNFIINIMLNITRLT